MSTLIASFHHDVQAINKAAQIREAYLHGHKTVQAVQGWLKSKGVRATDAHIYKTIRKLNSESKGNRTLKLRRDANRLLNDFVDVAGGFDDVPAFGSKQNLLHTLHAAKSILEAAKDAADFLLWFDSLPRQKDFDENVDKLLVDYDNLIEETTSGEHDNLYR